MYVLLSFGNSLKDEDCVEFLDSNCPRRFKGSDFDQEVCRLACHTLANSIAQGLGIWWIDRGVVQSKWSREKTKIWKWKFVDELIFMMGCAIHLCYHHYCGCVFSLQWRESQLQGNHHHTDGLMTALRLMMPAQSGSERAFARHGDESWWIYV